MAGTKGGDLRQSLLHVRLQNGFVLLIEAQLPKLNLWLDSRTQRGASTALGAGGMLLILLGLLQVNTAHSLQVTALAFHQSGSAASWLCVNWSQEVSRQQLQMKLFKLLQANLTHNFTNANEALKVFWVLSVLTVGQVCIKLLVMLPTSAPEARSESQAAQSCAPFKAIALPWPTLVNQKGLRCRNSIIYTVFNYKGSLVFF